MFNNGERICALEDKIAVLEMTVHRVSSENSKLADRVKQLECPHKDEELVLETPYVWGDWQRYRVVCTSCGKILRWNLPSEKADEWSVEKTEKEIESLQKKIKNIKGANE